MSVEPRAPFGPIPPPAPAPPLAPAPAPPAPVPTAPPPPAGWPAEPVSVPPVTPPDQVAPTEAIPVTPPAPYAETAPVSYAETAVQYAPARVPYPPAAAAVPYAPADWEPDPYDATEVIRGAEPRVTAALIVPTLVGCLVAAALGVYGRLHEPTGVAINVAGFSSPQTVKVWLATIAGLLALAQVYSALVMYGKIRVRQGNWVGPVHRWSGRLAFLVSIPVALHCLYALGFGDYNTRVLLHSLLGCFFYGAFATKMLLLARKNVPSWALPIVGGLVFTALAGLFVTSSLWFFTTFGLKF